MKQKHLFYLKHAKGFRGRRKNCYTIARPAVEKSWQKAYIGRKQKRRFMRKSWISNLNAAVREQGINYSRFINGLRLSNILLNRKVLAELAVHEPYSFKSVLDRSIENCAEKLKEDSKFKIRVATDLKVLEENLERQKKISEEAKKKLVKE